jgi:hypothetical protein
LVSIEGATRLINDKVNITTKARVVLQIKHYNPNFRLCVLLQVLCDTCTKHTKASFEKEHYKHA